MRDLLFGSVGKDFAPGRALPERPSLLESPCEGSIGWGSRGTEEPMIVVSRERMNEKEQELRAIRV